MLKQFTVTIFVILISFTNLASVIGQDDVPPDEDPTVVIHVVQRGENLFRIALSYGLSTDQVAAANGISNPGSILVGQRLIIPVASATAVTQSNVPAVHTVRPGESLAAIASAYGLSLESLIALNSIDNPDRLYVGQEIVLSEDASLIENPARTTIHIVQTGETLFTIAQRYNTTVEALQQENALVDPTRIFSGQSLRVPGDNDARPDGLPPFVTSVSLRPLVLTEGKTGVLSLTTQPGSSVTATFLERELPMIVNTDSSSYVALLPVAVNTPPGIYPLALAVTAPDGSPGSIVMNVQIVAGDYGSQTLTIPADRVGLLAPGVEDNEMQILRSTTTPFNPNRLSSGPMSLPAAAAMNSPFGTQRSYNQGVLVSYHTGADFAGAPGTPVYAANAGRVVLADRLNIRGVSVIIDHGWGVYTNYSHLSERYVQFGDTVAAGQIIGTVGSSGRATGAHLHWELWVNGIPVDPMQWVRESLP